MKNLWVVILLVVIGGGAFYGGMRYGAAQAAANLNASGQNAQGGGFGGGRGGRGGGNGNGGFLTGSVLSKDAASFTVSLRDGGSKIVFYSPSTQVRKMADASMNDIAVGTNVTVMGSANSDGSVTAQNIQLRTPGSATSTNGGFGRGFGFGG